MTAPINLPPWALIPKTVYPNGSVEVGGVIYVQVANDTPSGRNEACSRCVAYSNMRLCDVLCCACDPAGERVFAQQLRGKNFKKKENP